MYPKFKEISLDTATWTVAFLGAIEERETKSKKPFCTFHLLDGAIAITANLWNTEKKDIYKVQEKSVISVQLYKKLYNGVETYEVKEYQAAPDDAKLEDYLLTAPIPSQDMMDEIKSILSKEISETELYPLVMEILDENADKLLYWAAAKTIHHNCYGGLLYHMLRMLKTAVILSRVYRFDKELLYSAVILHDIGKLQELDTDATGVAEYTVDGNLFGHTLLAIEMIDRKNFENPTYPAEKIRLLKHCMSTGHEGSMSTIHANSPRNMCDVRIPILYSYDKNADFSEKSIALQIAEAVQIIVQLSRFPDGSRKITAITEVDGLENSGKLRLNDIFLYDRQKKIFHATGNVPKTAIRKIRDHGISVDETIFQINVPKEEIKA